MPLSSVGAFAYVNVRSLLRSTGLLRLLKPQFRSSIAKMVYRFSTKPGNPVPIHGSQMILAPLGSFAPIDLVRDRFEIGTTKVFEETLKSGNCVLDIGANVGYFTLLAASLVGPEGRVYAFEPEPGNYEVLLKNLALNGYENVEAIPKAVSSEIGEAQLILSGLDSGFHSLAHLNLPERGSVGVETITIDSFLEEHGWPHVDLVKIDIEGWEVAALDGMDQFFQRANSVNLVIEFCPWIMATVGVTPESFIDRLLSYSLDVNLITTDGVEHLEKSDMPKLLDRLNKKDGYANLYCTRR